MIGSTLFGALLFADNLKESDQKKQIPVIIIFGVLWQIIMRRLLGPISVPYLPLVIANISGGLLLTGPIWKRYLSDHSTFIRRKIWGPLLSLVVLLGVVAFFVFWRKGTF